MPSIGLLPALALIAGATCGALIAWDVTRLMWTLPALWAVAMGSWWVSHSRLAIGTATAAFFVVGAVLAADSRARSLHTPLRAVLDAAFESYAIESPGPGGRHDPIPVRAIVLEDASTQSGVTTLRVEVQVVEVGGIEHDVRGGVSLSVSGAVAPQQVDAWRAGRAIDVPVTFRRPARYLNDGVADFERDLALAGTTLFGSVKSGLLIDVRAHGSALRELAGQARAHVRRAIARWVAPHDAVSAAIVTAVLIGERTGLPEDVRLRLQAAGTYHVIAISGGNIAILAGLALGILMCFGIRGRLAAAVTILILLAYASVVTGGASVWRATMMAVLYLTARLIDLRSTPWHAIGVAAALVVCARPLDVRDVGFLLTFGATAALLEAARRMTRFRGLSLAGRWILAAIVASVAAEVALLPVSAWTFSRVTSAGLALNLIAVPMMGIVQVAGILVASLQDLNAIARPAGWIAHAAATSIVESARSVDALPWLTARVPPPPVLVVLVYYAGLVTALAGRGIVRALAAIATGAAAVVIVSGIQPLVRSQSPRESELRLTTFDVGQGDATLLELPSLRMLVDTGGVPFGTGTFDIGARVLAPALWARGVRRLDTLLITHGDPDHAGGALSVARDFSPGELWEGVALPGHSVLRELTRLVEADGGQAIERRSGDALRVGGATIRVLRPPPPDWERRQVRNDDSLVLEVVYGDVAILIPGDISATIERRIAPRLTPARIRILKVAHHGSRTSSSRELLDQWRPTIAIISSGRGNTFGHPAPEVLRRLESIGAAVYRTDLDGQITVTSDGRSLQVNTFVRRVAPGVAGRGGLE